MADSIDNMIAEISDLELDDYTNEESKPNEASKPNHTADSKRRPQPLKETVKKSSIFNTSLDGLIEEVGIKSLTMIDKRRSSYVKDSLDNLIDEVGIGSKTSVHKPKSKSIPFMKRSKQAVKDSLDNLIDEAGMGNISSVHGHKPWSSHLIKNSLDNLISEVGMSSGTTVNKTRGSVVTSSLDHLIEDVYEEREECEKDSPKPKVSTQRSGVIHVQECDSDKASTWSSASEGKETKQDVTKKDVESSKVIRAKDTFQSDSDRPSTWSSASDGKSKEVKQAVQKDDKRSKTMHVKESPSTDSDKPSTWSSVHEAKSETKQPPITSKTDIKSPKIIQVKESLSSDSDKPSTWSSIHDVKADVTQEKDIQDNVSGSKAKGLSAEGEREKKSSSIKTEIEAQVSSVSSVWTDSGDGLPEEKKTKGSSPTPDKALSRKPSTKSVPSITGKPSAKSVHSISVKPSAKSVHSIMSSATSAWTESRTETESESGADDKPKRKKPIKVKSGRKDTAGDSGHKEMKATKAKLEIEETNDTVVSETSTGHTVVHEHHVKADSGHDIELEAHKSKDIKYGIERGSIKDISRKSSSGHITSRKSESDMTQSKTMDAKAPQVKSSALLSIKTPSKEQGKSMYEHTDSADTVSGSNTETEETKARTKVISQEPAFTKESAQLSVNTQDTRTSSKEKGKSMYDHTDSAETVSGSNTETEETKARTKVISQEPAITKESAQLSVNTQDSQLPKPVETIKKSSTEEVKKHIEMGGELESESDAEAESENKKSEVSTSLQKQDSETRPDTERKEELDESDIETESVSYADSFMESESEQSTNNSAKPGGKSDSGDKQKMPQRQDAGKGSPKAGTPTTAKKTTNRADLFRAEGPKPENNLEQTPKSSNRDSKQGRFSFMSKFLPSKSKKDSESESQVAAAMAMDAKEIDAKDKVLAKQLLKLDWDIKFHDEEIRRLRSGKPKTKKDLIGVKIPAEFTTVKQKTEYLKQQIKEFQATKKEVKKERDIIAKARKMKKNGKQSGQMAITETQKGAQAKQRAEDDKKTQLQATAAKPQQKPEAFQSTGEKISAKQVKTEFKDHPTTQSAKAQAKATLDKGKSVTAGTNQEPIKQVVKTKTDKENEAESETESATESETESETGSETDTGSYTETESDDETYEKKILKSPQMKEASKQTTGGTTNEMTAVTNKAQPLQDQETKLAGKTEIKDMKQHEKSESSTFDEDDLIKDTVSSNPETLIPEGQKDKKRELTTPEKSTIVHDKIKTREIPASEKASMYGSTESTSTPSPGDSAILKSPETLSTDKPDNTTKAHIDHTAVPQNSQEDPEAMPAAKTERAKVKKSRPSESSSFDEDDLTKDTVPIQQKDKETKPASKSESKKMNKSGTSESLTFNEDDLTKDTASSQRKKMNKSGPSESSTFDEDDLTKYSVSKSPEAVKSGRDNIKKTESSTPETTTIMSMYGSTESSQSSVEKASTDVKETAEGTPAKVSFDRKQKEQMEQMGKNAKRKVVLSTEIPSSIKEDINEEYTESPISAAPPSEKEDKVKQKAQQKGGVRAVTYETSESPESSSVHEEHIQGNAPTPPAAISDVMLKYVEIGVDFIGAKSPPVSQDIARKMLVQEEKVTSGPLTRIEQDISVKDSLEQVPEMVVTEKRETAKRTQNISFIPPTKMESKGFDATPVQSRTGKVTKAELYNLIQFGKEDQYRQERILEEKTKPPFMTEYQYTQDISLQKEETMATPVGICIHDAIPCCHDQHEHKLNAQEEKAKPPLRNVYFDDAVMRSYEEHGDLRTVVENEIPVNSFDTVNQDEELEYSVNTIDNTENRVLMGRTKDTYRGTYTMTDQHLCSARAQNKRYRNIEPQTIIPHKYRRAGPQTTVPPKSRDTEPQAMVPPKFGNAGPHTLTQYKSIDTRPQTVNLQNYRKTVPQCMIPSKSTQERKG